MKLALLQYKQNGLYCFDDLSREYSESDAKQWQQEVIAANEKMLRSAGELGCNVIVTSEAINYPGKYLDLIPNLKSEFFERMAEYAKAYKAYLFLGAYYKDDDENMYNAVLVYNPKGELQDRYHKIHLVGNENSYLVPGNKYKVISTEYGNIGVLICYDAQFPEAVRELALMGSDMVVCPTWGWEEIYGHARAYENGIFIASAMGIPYNIPIEGLRTPTEVVSPAGSVIVRGSYEQPGVITCEFDITQCRASREKRLAERHPLTYNLINRDKRNQ